MTGRFNDGQRVFVKAFSSSQREFQQELGCSFYLGVHGTPDCCCSFVGCEFGSLADDVAIWSFCSLVVRAILQLVCFLKYGEKGLVEVNEPG